MTAARRKATRPRGGGHAPKGERKKRSAQRRAAGGVAAGERAGEAGASGRAVVAANALGRWALWGLALVPPFLVSPTADDAFRLPKTAASETLVLVSLLALAAGWWSRGSVSLAELARRPATLFAALLVAAVLPGAIVATHPQHWQRFTVSLVIALGGLVMWSARLDQKALRRAVDLLALPAAALASLAILQAHGIFRPFAFAQSLGTRLELTSLAGSVGDFAGFLVLPALALQAAVARARDAKRRIAAAAGLALVAYALVLSETLAALAAAGAGTLVLWILVLPRRRRWLALAPLAAAGAVAALAPGLLQRISRKLADLQQLDLDQLFSGRLDGWKASLEMFREHPWFGVGHGGFGSSYAAAKLELLERGVEFFSRSGHFQNAHSDYLEALAEWGLVGAIAAVAAAAVLAVKLRDLSRQETVPDRALAIAGCAACAVLALASFPLRIALTGYSWVIFLAWILAAARANRDADPERAERRVEVPAWAWSTALCLLLAPALLIHPRSLLGRLEASRIARTTSQVAQLAMQSGALAARPVLQANLTPLRRAAELDGLAVTVALTTGSHHLLLGDLPAAVESYRRGLEIEPRPELYLNLARALLASGDREQAVAQAEYAVALDPLLAGEASALGLR